MANNNLVHSIRPRVYKGGYPESHHGNPGGRVEARQTRSTKFPIHGGPSFVKTVEGKRPQREPCAELG
jgi:hypothetical protein